MALSGTINLASAGSITTHYISNAAITINAAAPGRLAINTNSLFASTINSDVPNHQYQDNLSWRLADHHRAVDRKPERESRRDRRGVASDPHDWRDGPSVAT